MKDKPLIIALDFPSGIETMHFLEHFNESLYVKVGMELFYQEGAPFVYRLKELGHRIFLDLKLHDIPNTVQCAMRRIASFGVDLVNVHAAGGSAMMEAALEGLEAGTPSGQKRPSCIAVTQLTSTSQDVMSNEILINRPIEEVVLTYAHLASKSGMDGVVCSVHEVELIHSCLGERFLTVTPGIRPKSVLVNDQVRVATPEIARQLGSNAIVVGRAITCADNPLDAYRKMYKEWIGSIE
ncbi:MAG: orotidine 5-phosphate decarboxylase [Bacillales bacterium]|jgi:orotidine-5'-phosphate decarboxylase|nr:orotidine 5-phosphate decarboxylase [Bacillales bacterium]